MERKLDFFCFIALCVFGGVIGLQEFYRRKTGLGILAVIFAWTLIPCVVATVELFVWLFRGKEEFSKKYNRSERQILND